VRDTGYLLWEPGGAFCVPLTGWSTALLRKIASRRIPLTHRIF